MKLDGYHMISHMEFYSGDGKGIQFLRIFGAEIDGHEEIKFIECGVEPDNKACFIFESCVEHTNCDIVTLTIDETIKGVDGDYFGQ